MRALLAALLLALVCHAVALAVCGDGIVDPDEVCDGGECCAADCQSFLAPGTVCRPEAGPCDVAESCDGTSAACPADAKSTTECRAAAGDCDVAESCDGVSDTCPPDEFAPPTTPCRPAAGECDVQENCTGTGPDCPLDAKSTAECRPAAGPCDVPESCDGIGDACPPDGFAPPTMPCRPAAGACDVQENCTGTGPDCPLDAKSTAECRPAAGPCDVPESCDGIGNGCPSDRFAPPTVVCRPAVDQCDAAELCSGTGPTCPPDVPLPDETPCNDGDACTRTDRCESGICTGSSPVVCGALDVCHVAGTCDPATGSCSNPARPDNAACDDGNRCTTADSCQAGVCQGLPIAGCCRTDVECDDGVACTDDRCVANACTHVPLDDRCGSSGECRQLMCVPTDATADASGCVPRAIDEGSYCTEDGDPCTIDACHAGDCRHDADGSGARCIALVAPYRTVTSLLARTRELEAALRAAIAAACTRVGTSCDVEPSPDANRLVALLRSTESDLGTAALALAGRLAESSSSTASRDPVMRARLALGFLSGVPTELRGFLATLAQARAQHTVGSAYARARRAEGRHLLSGSAKLRRELLRIVARRQMFAR